MHAKLRTVLLSSFSLFVLLNLQDHQPAKWVVQAQSSTAKFDGFVYGDDPSVFNPNNILIEAFFDPVCPSSRDAWPPLKQALHFYGSRVSLVVHPFSLPYHDNSFVTSRALHIVNELNSSATYQLWESFLRDQEKFSNKATINMSRYEVVDHIVDFVGKSVGGTYNSAVKSGFSNSKTDIKTRVSFKYACSRGVFGTPSFFINGFPGSAKTYNGWRKIIDPLITSKSDGTSAYSK